MVSGYVLALLNHGSRHTISNAKYHNQTVQQKVSGNPNSQCLFWEKFPSNPIPATPETRINIAALKFGF
jgi:hypothetical protein